MIKFIKRKRGIIYFILGIIFLIPLVIEPVEVEPKYYSTSEQFDSKLSTINSIKRALEYVDSLSRKNQLDQFDTLQYVQTASKFTKNRFFHGLSRYKFSENWIAFLGATCFWDHMSAIVNPEDIIKHSNALCSQQSIVFLEILKRRGIKSRSVGLGYKEGPGHFLAEVYYNNEWHLYDVNKEPKWEKIKNHHRSMEYYTANKDTLFVPYEDQMEKKAFYKILEKVEYGEVNEFPAKNMILFHRVTKVVTYILPIFFLLMSVRVFSRIGRGRKSKEIKKKTVINYEGVKINS